MQIGLAHHKQRTALRQALLDLKQASTGEFVHAFEKQIEKLDAWTARIAAIGQVKAGKSSTLNALIGEIGFLPSDVNPWTTVVTNMRVNIPGDAKNGARFEFFDEESWDRIINGDPRVREAAKKFLPGFDPEILREQTEEMREHAARRLGPSYVKLLGSQHDYDLLSDDLLESYVCAGPGSNEISDDDTIGRYAAITKVANLFMQLDDYAVPTIITDTPGVNDPFLVRDEFTCQSLDQSDIFLVMLSAHQALTEVDIALIRMLAMQDDKEVIIYINRVDELENAHERIKHIVADVTERISEAIEGAKFTVVFGSAHWAEQAMDTDLADAELLKIVSRSNVDTFNAIHRTETPQAAREKLLIASGIPEIKKALSRAIDVGSGAEFLNEITTEVGAQLAAMRALAQRQRHDLQDRIELYGSGKVADYRETLEDEMTSLAEVHSALSELIEEANEDLDAAINKNWVDLQQQMDRHTSLFITDQRSVIEKLWSGDLNSAKAQVDLLPLRTALEASFHQGYERARGALDKMLDDTMEQAAKIAKRATAGADAQISMAGLPGESVAVTFATSEKKLSFDLVSKRNWTFWKTKKVDLDKTIEGLKRVTSAEVFPATNKMVEAFTNTISERALAGKARLNLLSNIVEQSLNDRIKRLREDYKLLKGEQDDAAKEKILNRLHSDIEVIDNRLQVIASKESAVIVTDQQAA